MRSGSRKGGVKNGRGSIPANQFDAAVFGASVFGGIGGGGAGEAASEGEEAVFVDAVFAGECGDDGAGAAGGEVAVEFEVADIVGVSDDDDFPFGFVFQKGGDLFEGGIGFRFEGIFVEFEVDAVEGDASGRRDLGFHFGGFDEHHAVVAAFFFQDIEAGEDGVCFDSHFGGTPASGDSTAKKGDEKRAGGGRFFHCQVAVVVAARERVLLDGIIFFGLIDLCEEATEAVVERI